MKFRPCIDLHQGVVKQIVGGTLPADAVNSPVINFVADQPPSHFARRYREDGLYGGHVIMLGPGNEAAARDALAAWPGGLQVGGGITAENARSWLECGAAGVIVTSYVFRDGLVDLDRLQALVQAVGRDRLVLDLSCRQRDGRYWIVTDRWQRFTEVPLDPAALESLAGSCSEFLIHAVDVEGLCRGIESELAAQLGAWTPIPTTYAGGISSMEDIQLLRDLGRGRLDFTVGSALDIFGGHGLRYTDLVTLNRDSH